jgi:CRISPR-associated protein Csb2
MALAVSLSFPAGRFHCTPWSHHVNEGLPEWTPSPWRFLRALVAVWKRKLSMVPSVNALLPGVLAKLTTPPLFSLPSASLGHSRHYMPWFKRGPQDKTLVFDAFVALDSTAEIVFLWPDVELDATEKQTLCLVLSQLGYFGRSESWCIAQLHEGWEPGGNGGWIRCDKTTGEVIAQINCVPLVGGNRPDGAEPIRVLAADPQTWNTWSYSKAVRPDPPWNLLAETADLHAERWSDPPGSRWLIYLRPTDAFAVAPSLLSPRSRVCPANRRTSGCTIVRYALDGTVLPLVQETLSLGELVRQRLQGIYGRQNGGATSAIFSGKAADGTPLQGHRHAFYLPTDEDHDGRLDHLTVYARGQLGSEGQDLGFAEVEMYALDVFRQLRQVGGKPDLQLVLLGVGNREDWANTSLFCRSRQWQSVTPFVPPRHQRTRGRKRETPVQQLQADLQRRGFPNPTAVYDLPQGTSNGRSLRWIEFRRERLFGGGSRGQGVGYGFVIEFAEPVDGPLCLGYGCHFGLGLFAATTKQ